MKPVLMKTAKARQYTSVYSSFVGVDFSTDPMLVDKNHSPYALNLVADDGGMPEKRPARNGWASSAKGREKRMGPCGNQKKLCAKAHSSFLRVFVS